MAAQRHGQQQFFPLNRLTPPGTENLSWERRFALSRPAKAPVPPSERLDQAFRALAENLPDAVMRYDRQLRCVYANPAIEPCLEVTRQRVIGKGSGALGLPRRLAALFDNSLRLVLAGGQATVIEFALGTTGGERHIEVRFVPEVGPSGAVESALAIAHDVTERKRSERALVDKTDALQRSNAELQEFAYVASHDLKGPLRNAHALSTWIEEEVGPHLSEAGRQRMALLRSRLERMDELIDATLQFARAGASVGTCEEVDVAELVQEAIDACPRPEGFTVFVKPDLPHLRADRCLLQQVLSNLIANAITHHDRADGRVWVTAREVGNLIEFSVIDDGPGIAPEYHERIFHMFQRGPGARLGASHGLGLAIVRKVVGRAGGQVELDSAPGWGSTFTFTWPKGR